MRGFVVRASDQDGADEEVVVLELGEDFDGALQEGLAALTFSAFWKDILIVSLVSDVIIVNLNVQAILQLVIIGE